MNNKLKNCINCGAPLTGPICEYCGTRYEEENKFSGKFFEYSMQGEIEFDGHKIPVYISEIECYNLDLGCVGRDISGRLIRDRSRMIRKFTMVEV